MLIQEWIFVSWHLKGAPELDKWLTYSNRRRKIIVDEVRRRIEMHNDQFEH